MAAKTYFSRSDISISVVVDGKGLHLSFIPVSGGGSVYTTKDDKIQDAIEKHHNFGKLFNVRFEQKTEKVEKKAKVKMNNAETGTVSDKGDDGANGDLAVNGEVGEAGDKTTITVSCPDDAKDYLADRFGISRTSMKTVKAIKSIAESQNIEFVGI